MQKFTIALLMFIVTGSAKAQIVYTDIPDTTISATTQQQMVAYSINFDGDTAYEKQVRHFNPGGMPPMVELGNYPSPDFTCQEILLPDGHAKVLQVGDSIAPTTSQWGHDGFGILNAPWYGGDKYLGVRFKRGGKYYYGWIHFSVPSDGSSFTLKDWAYNKTAGQGLMAGQPVATGIAQTSKTGITVAMEDGVVRITTIGHASSRLCDMSGRVVKTMSTNGRGSMDISSLQPGLYILVVSSGSETHTCKLLIR